MNLIERLHKEPLSLTVKLGDVPFELTPEEAAFGPEDWAWQFLRLNEDYREAYAIAREKPQHMAGRETRQPGRIGVPHANRSILADEDICREKFGLSTWLDPKSTRLSELEPGESWFSPLRPVVIRHGHRTSPNSYPMLRGTFGAKTKFFSRPSAPFRGGHESYSPPHLHFLVDSTIPPNSQLAEIAGIARYVEERCRHAAAVSGSGHRKKPVVGKFSEGFFSRNDLGIPLEPRQNKSRLAALWSTVEIDFHNASARALDEVRKKLLERHETLVQQQLAATPPWDRLRIDLRSPREPTRSNPAADGPSRQLTDGHRLKAYAVIEEIVQKAGSVHLKARDIDDALIELSRTTKPEEPNQSWGDWLASRQDRIPRYLADARKFVDRNYRWLIYTQKP